MCVSFLVWHFFRKKFFIFNDDMDEAERNPLLRDLLYHQVFLCFNIACAHFHLRLFQFQTQLLHQRKTSRNVRAKLANYYKALCQCLFDY